MSLSQTATIPAWMMSKKKYIPVIFSNGTNRRGSANVLPPLIPWLTYLYIMRSILRDYIKVKFFAPHSLISLITRVSLKSRQNPFLLHPMVCHSCNINRNYNFLLHHQMHFPIFLYLFDPPPIMSNIYF